MTQIFEKSRKIIKIVTTVVVLQLSLLLPVGQAYGQTSGRSDANDDVEALRLSSQAVDYQIFWGQNGYFAEPSRNNIDYNFSGSGSFLGFGEDFGGSFEWEGFGSGEVPLGGGLLVLALSGVCYAGAKRVKRLKLKD